MLKGITVGCGYFGQIQLEGWERVAGGRIQAVVDKDEAKAKETAEKFGISGCYTDLKEGIENEELDFVDVVTGPVTHREMVKTAAEAGLDVLCQKPIAPNWGDSVQLVRACEESGVRLMINENWRWQPWYQKVKELIEAGTIGELNTIDIIRHESDALQSPPFSDQPYFLEMEPFLLIESVIHQIDTTRFLGGEIREVFGDLRRVSGVTNGEDSVCLNLRLEEGRLGRIYSTRTSEPNMPDPRCDYARIEGEGGFIRLDRDGTVTVKPLFEPPREVDYEIPEEGYRGGSCRAALAHFARRLREGGPFQTGGRDYLEGVMKAVFAGYRSDELGESIELDSLLNY